MSKPDLVANAADEKQVKRAKAVEDLKQDNELADIVGVMSTPGGRGALCGGSSM